MCSSDLERFAARDGALERGLVNLGTAVERLGHALDVLADAHVADAELAQRLIHVLEHQIEQRLTDGVGARTATADASRFAVTHDDRDRGAFKTPTLRDVALTAPYMHDGSLATLEDVVEFYDRGGVRNPNQDRRMRPLNLSADEKRQLVAFLKALNGRITEGVPGR